jgi:predicted MFS family arabinose efflux permease
VARLPGHILGCAIPLLAIIACALLLQPNATLAARFVAAFLLYAATSMEGHLFAYVTSRYFGLRAFGFVYGLIGSFMAIAIGAGPVLAGYVFDQRGSYDLILIAGIPVAAIASILMYSLGRYPDWSG